MPHCRLQPQPQRLEERWRIASQLSAKWGLVCDIGDAAARLAQRGGLLRLSAAAGETRHATLPRLVEVNTFVESHGEAAPRLGPLGPGALTQHYEAGGQPSRFYSRPTARIRPR